MKQRILDKIERLKNHPLSMPQVYNNGNGFEVACVGNIYVFKSLAMFGGGEYKCQVFSKHINVSNDEAKDIFDKIKDIVNSRQDLVEEYLNS